MNETAQQTLESIPPELKAYALIGACFVLALVMAYFVFLGAIMFRPTGVKREIIGRALREMPASQDPIIAKRQRKLLEEYREKPE